MSLAPPISLEWWVILGITGALGFRRVDYNIIRDKTAFVAAQRAGYGLSECIVWENQSYPSMLDAMCALHAAVCFESPMERYAWENLRVIE